MYIYSTALMLGNLYYIFSSVSTLTTFFYITRVGDAALVAIAEGCSLHYLNVSGCHQIGDGGVVAIARGCPQLCYLDVSVLQVCIDISHSIPKAMQ